MTITGWEASLLALMIVAAYGGLYLYQRHQYKKQGKLPAKKPTAKH